MRIRITLLTCAALATVQVLANPIMMSNTPYGSTRYGELFWCVTITALLLEYMAIRLAFGRQFTFWQGLLAFLGIHLLTFPLTTVAAVTLNWGWYAEGIPVVLEPLVFLLIAYSLRAKIPLLVPKVIGANLLSFMVGIALFALFRNY